MGAAGEQRRQAGAAGRGKGREKAAPQAAPARCWPRWLLSRRLTKSAGTGAAGEARRSSGAPGTAAGAKGATRSRGLPGAAHPRQTGANKAEMELSFSNLGASPRGPAGAWASPAAAAEASSRQAGAAREGTDGRRGGDRRPRPPHRAACSRGGAGSGRGEGARSVLRHHKVTSTQTRAPAT